MQHVAHLTRKPGLVLDAARDDQRSRRGGQSRQPPSIVPHTHLLANETAGEVSEVGPAIRWSPHPYSEELGLATPPPPAQLPPRHGMVIRAELPSPALPVFGDLLRLPPAPPGTDMATSVGSR